MRVGLCVLLACFAVTSGAQTPGGVRTFDEDKPGAPPAGFSFDTGRDAAPGRWIVQSGTTGQFLAYLGPPTPLPPADAFAVAIDAGGSHESVGLSVRLKTEGGRGAAGLVWRYHDPLNHYAVQLDLAKQELAVYRVAGGNRIRIEREDDLELDPDAWHTLRLVQDNTEVRAYLGGIRVFTERERRSPIGGRVGLWVSAGAVAAFDDFRVEPRIRSKP